MILFRQQYSIEEEDSAYIEVSVSAATANLWAGFSWFLRERLPMKMVYGTKANVLNGDGVRIRPQNRGWLQPPFTSVLLAVGSLQL